MCLKGELGPEKVIVPLVGVRVLWQDHHPLFCGISGFLPFFFNGFWKGISFVVFDGSCDFPSWEDLAKGGIVTKRRYFLRIV